MLLLSEGLSPADCVHACQSADAHHVSVLALHPDGCSVKQRLDSPVGMWCIVLADGHLFAGGILTCSFIALLLLHAKV